MTIRVTNAGPDADTLHVLPHLWYRNTWSWDGTAPHELVADGTTVRTEHPFLGPLTLDVGPDAELLFCDNETNTERLFGVPGPRYPKDGINDHVVTGAATVNPAQRGSKCAAWYRLTVAGGETDAFYADLTPDAASADEALVMRQAFAGMLWSKQFYHYDVATWLDGDPAQPPPPQQRHGGRNARWRTFDAYDVLSMPDTWEYPWFAAWDLAFHCVALAHVDPAFAKYQLTL